MRQTIRPSRTVETTLTVEVVFVKVTVRFGAVTVVRLSVPGVLNGAGEELHGSFPNPQKIKQEPT